MLEAAIVLQIGLGEYVEAAVIGGLLLFNATLGLHPGRPGGRRARGAQEAARADRAGLPRRRVGQACRRRNSCPATRSGCRSAPWFRPTRRIVSGSVMVDQSMLTGESVPVDAEPGSQVYAGSLVRRGQAIAEVTATGAKTYFGRTAELVRVAHAASTEQAADFRGDAQPRDRQRHGRGAHHRLRLCHGAAVCRSDPPCADRAAGHDPGGAAGDIHAVGRVRRADTGPRAAFC